MMAFALRCESDLKNARYLASDNFASIYQNQPFWMSIGERYFHLPPISANKEEDKVLLKC